MTGAPAEAIKAAFTQEDLDRARREGMAQGETKALLESLHRMLNTQENKLTQILNTQAESKAETRMILERLNAHGDDIAKMERRIDRVEREYVERSEHEESLKPLKAMADRVDGFLWKVFLMVIGGSGTSLGAGYLVLRSAGMLR